MSFLNGVQSLTNWLGNVIMPTLAALFLAGAIYRFSKGQASGRLTHGAFASLMCSGLLRTLEGFSQQAAWNDPDGYWKAILTLVDWTGNVLLPLYGVLQVVTMVLHFAGVLERINIGNAWVRNAAAAMMCFSLSGMVRLMEYFVEHGKAGVH